MKPIDIHRAYERVFKTPDGETLLEDLKKAHHFYSSTARSDALSMALAEGERNVILRILAILEHKEEDYVSRPAAQ